MPRTHPLARTAVLLAAGCTTTPAPQDGKDCASFIELDHAWTARESSAGSRLLEVSEAASAARRACARSILRSVPSRLMSSSDVGPELEAIVRTLGLGPTRALAVDVLGESEARLVDRWLLEAGRPAPEIPEGAFTAEPPPSGPCDDHGACERVECLVSSGAEQPAVDRAAQACVDRLATVNPTDHAARLASLAERLKPRGPSASLTEVLTRLETLRQRAWPGIQAQVSSGRLTAAASRARPFEVLPGARSDVRMIRQAAVQVHERLAARPDAGAAAWLHRALIASLSGAPVPPAGIVTGVWDAPSWSCPGSPPKLPPAVPGIRLRLRASCPEPAPPSTPPGEISTFDYQSELMGALRAVLDVSCRGAHFEVPIQLTRLELEVGDDGGAHAVQLAVSLAGTRCRPDREAASVCAQLAVETSLTLEARMIELYRSSGSWAPCFSAYVARRYGLELELP